MDKVLTKAINIKSETDFNLSKICSIEKITGAVVAMMLVLSITATICFVRSNSHFIEDDLRHFIDSRTQTLWSMLKTPIDVHFAPLHQFASFIVFKFFGLNFDVALGAEAVCWVVTIALIHRLLRSLASNKIASIITLLFGVSPLWLHTLIWWSASAHRLPYLLLQVMVLLMYLRYREKEKNSTAFFCMLIQVLSLGFFIKGILFPALLAAFEFCLASRSNKLSRAGLKLCVVMCAISVFYVGWYFFVFARVAPPDYLSSLWPTFLWATIYISRLGSLLLFLPIDQAWAGWVSSLFWIMLAGWRIYRCPISVFPMVALLVLLFINFALSIWGRGFFIIFPFSSLRYYPDVLVTVAVFATCALASNQVTQARGNEVLRKVLPSALLLALTIIYPVASYFSNQQLFSKIYISHKQTHKFMINAQQTLGFLNAQPDPRVLQADFPSFVFGWMDARLPLKDIFGKLYPKIEWVPFSQAKNGVIILQDNGRAVPLVLPGT